MWDVCLSVLSAGWRHAAEDRARPASSPPPPATSGISLSGLILFCASLFTGSLVAACGGARLSSPAPHYFLQSRGAKTPDSSDAESEGEKESSGSREGMGGGQCSISYWGALLRHLKRASESHAH